MRRIYTYYSNYYCTKPYFDNVPKEIIFDILNYLPIASILSFRRLSKPLCEITKNNNFWNQLFHNNYGTIEKNKHFSEIDYKQYYLRIKKLSLDDALDLSIRSGCINHCKSLIINYNACDFNPFHKKYFILTAAFNGMSEIVELLIKHNICTVDETCPGEPTPLCIACGKLHIDTVKILIKYNANIECEYRGDVPLFISSELGNTEIVEYLLDNGANVNYTNSIDGATALYIAAKTGQNSVIELLLNRGANIEAVYEKVQTPLYVAALNGNIDSVKMLIRYNANVNVRDDNGKTPLYVSSQNGSHEIVELLLNAGANPDIFCNNGYTPLYMASINGRHKVVEILAKRFNVNKLTQNPITPLYIACQHGHFEVVSVLLNNDIDYINSFVNNHSPLYIALIKEHYDIVQLLLTKIDVITNINHSSESEILLIPCSNNNLDIAKLLLQNGAKPFKDPNNLDNILHVAITKKFTDRIIDWLIKTFPELLFEENNIGVTPLELALKFNNSVITNYVYTFCKTNNNLFVDTLKI